MRGGRIAQAVSAVLSSRGLLEGHREVGVRAASLRMEGECTYLLSAVTIRPG